MQFETESEVFQKSKERYATMLAEGVVDTFDEMVVPFIKLANTFDELSTIFCCSGHLDKDPDGPTNGYVLFVVQKQGAAKLFDFFNKLRFLKPGYRGTDFELTSPYDIFQDKLFEHVYDAIIIRSPYFERNDLIKEFWHEAGIVLNDVFTSDEGVNDD